MVLQYKIQNKNFLTVIVNIHLDSELTQRSIAEWVKL
jgi:hypothetical protein